MMNGGGPVSMLDGYTSGSDMSGGYLIISGRRPQTLIATIYSC